MAVVYAACVDGLLCSFSVQLAKAVQEWEEREYLGTLKSPGVELPSTEAAFEIPA